MKLLILILTNMQYIVLEMENYYKQAQKYEKKIFQQYVDRCTPFYSKYN